MDHCQKQTTILSGYLSPGFPFRIKALCQLFHLHQCICSYREHIEFPISVGDVGCWLYVTGVSAFLNIAIFPFRCWMMSGNNRCLQVFNQPWTFGIRFTRLFYIILYFKCCWILFAKICEGILMPLEQALVLKEWIKWFKVEEVIELVPMLLPTSETLGMISPDYLFRHLDIVNTKRGIFSANIDSYFYFFNVEKIKSILFLSFFLKYVINIIIVIDSISNKFTNF